MKTASSSKRNGNACSKANPTRSHISGSFTRSYHCNMNIDIPTLLMNWAKDIAQPYLKKHYYPNRLTPDTTDPRKGRLQYNEPDLMEIEEDGKTLALTESEWQLVARKQRSVTSLVKASTAKAIATPLLGSPRHKVSINASKANKTPPSQITNSTPSTNVRNHYVCVSIGHQRARRSRSAAVLSGQWWHPPDHRQMETTELWGALRR